MQKVNNGVRSQGAHRFLVCSAAAIALIWPVKVTAQNSLEEIVVTARKREEKMMNVPVAVSAVSAQTIEKTGTTDLAAIAKLAPELMVSRAESGSGASFTIRGIGTPFADTGTEQSVAVDIDGFVTTRGNVVEQGFFDLQQVEVMKGPQALFFGKNSPAGVVALHSVDPTDNYEGYLRFGYEADAEEFYGEGAVGGPIIDDLKGRIAVRGSEMNGWLHNTAVPIANNPLWGGATTPGAPSSGNGGQDTIVKGTLVWSPTDAFDANLKVSEANHQDYGGVGQLICPPGVVHSEDGFGAPNPLATDPTGDCKLDNNYAQSGIPQQYAKNWPGVENGMPYTNSQSWLGVLKMNYYLPNITLTSVTGYSNLDFKQSTNYTYNSFAGILVPLGEKTSSWSEEIRAVSDYDFPVNFTVGGYYGGEHRLNFTGAFLGFTGVNPATGTVQTYDNIARNGGTTLSAFAEVRIKPTEDIEIAGGARYTQEWKDTDQATTYINPFLAGPFLLRPIGDPLSGHYTDNNWSPQATVTWRPTDDLTIYAAYKTGYKSGGFSAPNLLQTVQTSNNAKFASEDSWGYEAGIKTYFDDRKGRAELTFYNYVFNNLQVSEFDQQTFTYFIRNAAAARTQGIELSGQYLALPGLTLNGSANYNDAHFLSFPGALCYPGQILNGAPCASTGGHQSLSGASLDDAPKWTLTGGFDYEFAITDDWSIGVDADTTYYGSYWTVPDHSPVSYQTGYFLVNVGARLHTTDDQWELAFIGRDINNQVYQISGSDTPFAIPGVIETYTPRFRQLMLQVTWRYK